MIVVLRRDAKPEEVEHLERLVREAGLRTEVSRGEESDLLVVVGETRGTPLEAALARHPAAARVVPILAPRRYERLFSRRSFLDAFIATLSAAAALLGLGAASLFLSRSGEDRRRTNLLRAGTVQDFEQRPSRLVDHDGRPLLVLRAAGGDFHALSAVCTHSEVCTVQWSAERQEIACPCHRAAYDVFGNVRRGPPPRPLPVYPVKVIGDTVYLKVEV